MIPFKRSQKKSLIHSRLMAPPITLNTSTKQDSLQLDTVQFFSIATFQAKDIVGFIFTARKSASCDLRCSVYLEPSGQMERMVSCKSRPPPVILSMFDSSRLLESTSLQMSSRRGPFRRALHLPLKTRIYFRPKGLLIGNVRVQEKGRDEWCRY